MAKVLFLSTNPAAFRSTFIGYLYEVAQRHSVLLLIEGLDSYTKDILNNKNMFPGLEKILFFESPFHGNIVAKNYHLHKIMQKTVQDFKPDIVVADSDMWPAGMYLMRLAKKAGAITVVMQSGFKIAEQKKLFLWSCLTNTYTRMPRFLPFGIRMMLVKLKKWAGYALYHWIFPLSVGESPFFGKTSFLFWHESAGLRQADYAVVFSQRDYDICKRDGVDPQKLFVISHPLEHESTKKFFEKAYFSENRKKEDKKTVTIMWSEEKTGFREGDYSLISATDMRESRIKQVMLISEKLVDWKIFIKPHPAEKEVPQIKEFLGRISGDISVVNPSEPADAYIEKSDVIVGMPPPSTTLFTAQKQHPEMPIVHMNLIKEFLADAYKDFEGIE